jgi:cellulose synthase/poly-beta-1,6-N-acetylglucosamine synthase-like glycosyltransferase
MITPLLFFLLLIAALSLLILSLVLCGECLAAALPARPRGFDTAASRPRVAALIPAHNESSGINQTIISIQEQLFPGDQLIVIADNCTDDTASVSHESGATVIERDNPTLRGKGYALAFGIEHLKRNPPEVVVFYDADCRVGKGSIEHLARLAHACQRPVQGLNLCSATSNSASQVMSALAFRLKNKVRSAGLFNVADCCHLTGTGMALPWPLVERIPWASGNVVEDMQLGIDLAVLGSPPIFSTAACVLSDLPGTKQGEQVQRLRWEHGHLQTIFSQAPKLMWQALIGRRFDLMCLALDLMIPPLTLFLLLLVICFAVASAYAIFTGTWLPLAIIASAIVWCGLALVIAWTIDLRQAFSYRDLLLIPFYIVAKVPIYLRFITHRQTTWVRTTRNPVPPHQPLSLVDDRAQSRS